MIGRRFWERPKYVFYHALALKIGGMTVAEMLHRMSALEIDDWRDYFEGDAEFHRLVGEKVRAHTASEMVWLGPEQRAELAEDEDE
jgi:hypothetical protein